jgi:ADP-ribose pyrophosphatase
MENRPQVISSQERFAGRVFRVRTDVVRYADGGESTLDIIEHRGSYAIIAVSQADSIVLVRQYRHPAGRELWEVPAGTAEPGEAILQGALRELAEETGFRAARACLLGSLYMTPGFCNELLHFVYARELTPGATAFDEDERIEVRTFTLDEAERLVAAGEIADAKTVLALYWMRGPRGELAASLADN